MYNEDYLMHHGVKGMKWGVRKDPERSLNRVKKVTYSNGYRKMVRGLSKTPFAKGVNKISSTSDRLSKARKQSLKEHDYQRYSKTNNPISATINATKELSAYRKDTTALIKSQKSGKAKVKTFIERWGNEPVTVLGFTGTAKTKRKQYLKGIYPGNGLY